ncbi:hypothetical protein M1D89_02465 [Arthrobacter sp. D3-18]
MEPLWSPSTTGAADAGATEKDIAKTAPAIAVAKVRVRSNFFRMEFLSLTRWRAALAEGCPDVLA